jgi:hypothetical protein
MKKAPVRLLVTWLFAFSLVALIVSSCKHEVPVPVVEDDDDGNGGGGGGNSNLPCDSDSVYFSMQILPILQSNCGMSGCHDAGTASDGVVLTSYASVMNSGIVTPFNISNSDLYEVLVETDPDKRMPPNGPLPANQIQLIQAWIQQGALNKFCDGGCDTLNVTYSGTIRPLLQTKCQGCHQGSSGGGGVDLSTYTGVASAVFSGRLMGSVEHLSGFSPMPKNGAKLPDCDLAKLRIWVNAGYPNN